MSIVKSSRNKDQLLLDRFRYRRANKSQTVWRCYKNNCVGRVRFDDLHYVKVTDHVHPPVPEETISMQFKSKIVEQVAKQHPINPSIYGSLADFKVEQHANLIMAEQLQQEL